MGLLSILWPLFHSHLCCGSSHPSLPVCLFERWSCRKQLQLLLSGEGRGPAMERARLFENSGQMCHPPRGQAWLVLSHITVHLGSGNGNKFVNNEQQRDGAAVLCLGPPSAHQVAPGRTQGPAAVDRIWGTEDGATAQATPVTPSQGLLPVPCEGRLFGGVGMPQHPLPSRLASSE